MGAGVGEEVLCTYTWWNGSEMLQWTCLGEVVAKEMGDIWRGRQGVERSAPLVNRES